MKEVLRNMKEGLIALCWLTLVLIPAVGGFAIFAIIWNTADELWVKIISGVLIPLGLITGYAIGQYLIKRQ